MLRRLADELLALVVPPACLACRCVLPGAGDPLCPSCRRALPWLPEPRCPRCALPAPCGSCPAAGAPFGEAWAPLAHDGPARALVVALKFRGRLPVADVDGRADRRDGAAGPALRPVRFSFPYPRTRAAGARGALTRRSDWRGALARRTGLPWRAALRRSGSDARQVGASRAGPPRAGAIGRRRRRRRARPRRAGRRRAHHRCDAPCLRCRAARRGRRASPRCVTYARTLRGG